MKLLLVFGSGIKFVAGAPVDELGRAGRSVVVAVENISEPTQDSTAAGTRTEHRLSAVVVQ